MTSGTFRDLLGDPGCVVALVGLPEHEALERRYADGGDTPRG